MTQVSKYPISKEVADRIFDLFLKTFVEIKNKSDADEFISDLLTPTEKIMLAKRLAIAFMLEKGYDYRTIQRILRVSSPTITSVNIARQYGSEGYKKLVKKIMAEEQLVDFFEEAVGKIIALPAQAKGKGTGTWRYLKEELDKHRKEKHPKAF